MHEGETELEMAQRHVASGRRLIENQRRILAELRADEHPTTAAEQLLQELERSQQLHEEHLRSLG